MKKQKSTGSRRPIYRGIKRTFDIAFSIIAIVLLSPVMLIVAIAVRVESKGPVLYMHDRVGRDFAPIRLYKVRTMYSGMELDMEALTPEQRTEWKARYKLVEDPRLTRVGRFLRRTSLDEVPQFINILKGELSLIGPRPVIAEELERYGSRKAEFLSVKPGLTGYWQAYARNRVSYDRRMEMELFYVRNASLWLDTKCFFRTFGRLISQKGAE